MKRACKLVQWWHYKISWFCSVISVMRWSEWLMPSMYSGCSGLIEYHFRIIWSEWLARQEKYHRLNICGETDIWGFVQYGVLKSNFAHSQTNHMISDKSTWTLTYNFDSDNLLGLPVYSLEYFTKWSFTNLVEFSESLLRIDLALAALQISW